jgi:transposase-like protein
MDTAFHNMFDEIVNVKNVYNTLILYEGRHYHAANAFFGKTLKDARLAQVFFVSKIDAQKYSSFPLKRTQAVNV